MKIEGYQNYEVTTTGDIINTKTGRVLKSFKVGNGYLQVSLSKNGKQKNFYIHRLVAEAFITNPLNLPCVNHKDEDKTNNNVENLEYCTHEYNNNYGTRTEKASKTMTNGKNSKPIIQLRKDGSLVRVWSSAYEAERQLHYHQSNISACCLGKIHTAYGFKWSYNNEVTNI